jgi:hypothetical protein
VRRQASSDATARTGEGGKEVRGERGDEPRRNVSFPIVAHRPALRHGFDFILAFFAGGPSIAGMIPYVRIGGRCSDDKSLRGGGVAGRYVAERHETPCSCMAGEPIAIAAPTKTTIDIHFDRCNFLLGIFGPECVRVQLYYSLDVLWLWAKGLQAPCLE